MFYNSIYIIMRTNQFIKNLKTYNNILYRCITIYLFNNTTTES